MEMFRIEIPRTDRTCALPTSLQPEAEASGRHQQPQQAQQAVLSAQGAPAAPKKGPGAARNIE